MDAQVLTVEELRSGECLSRIATDGTHVALAHPDGRGTEIISLRSPSAPPLLLGVHTRKRSPTAICLGCGHLGTSDPTVQQPVQEPTPLLVVAYPGVVLAWSLEAAYAAAAESHPCQAGLELVRPDEGVEALCISTELRLLTVCTGSNVLVIDLLSTKTIFRLEGHTAAVTAACFALHAPHLLATTSEDRTLKVWDLEAGALLYKSPILGASPLTAIAMDPCFPRAALAASDGSVRFFDLSALPECRCTQVVDVSKAVRKAAEAAAAVSAVGDAPDDGPRVISAGPSWQQPQALRRASSDVTPAVVAGGGAVLAIQYMLPQESSGDEDGPAPLLGSASQLLVAFSNVLALLDTQTYDLLQVLWLGAEGYDLPKRCELAVRHQHLATVDPAGCAALAPLFDGFHSVCCLAGAFSPCFAVLALAPDEPSCSSGSSVVDAGEAQQGVDAIVTIAAPASSLSIFQSQPLPEDSPLLHVSKAGTTGGGVGRGASSSKKTGARTMGRYGSSSSQRLGDKPVTFHSKVKSSGYGFVQPKVKLGRAPPAPVKVGRGGAKTALGRLNSEGRQYPMDCGPLTEPQPRNKLPGNTPIHHSAITQICYSGDAGRLLSASTDKTARGMTLPLSRSRGEGTDFIGHNAAVLSICSSHDGTMVLTGSADRSARLWSAAYAQPLLEFTHLKQPPPAAANGAAAPAVRADNPAFLSDVRAARFCYLDQFVLLAVGSRLHLYKYQLGTQDDDVERLRNDNRYKLLASYSTASQTVNDVAVANSFLSTIAIAVGSNKSIEIVDLATMQCARTLEDVHARPAHAVRLGVQSLFVSHPRDAYELFATAANDSLVKLWDVRSPKGVRAFAGHTNRQIPAGCALSPCMRYLAAGGEDKAATLYDLRTGSVMARLRSGHGEGVADCAFHPLHPQLAVACLDGHVHFYSDAV